MSVRCVECREDGRRVHPMSYCEHKVHLFDEDGPSDLNCRRVHIDTCPIICRAEGRKPQQATAGQQQLDLFAEAAS